MTNTSLPDRPPISKGEAIVATPDVVVTGTGAQYQVNVSARGHHWLADEPVEVGGADTAPQPGELLLSSLGACTAITLQMYANRKQWPLENVKITLRFNKADKPDGDTTVIDREIALFGPLSAEQQQRLMQIADACPIHKVLTHPVIIQTKPA
ncbi:OsmC family protein [Chitinophaga pendula]|uniref:OsmC family protein n=1 Tax=Chitinophaga TaxID=79328 RepID=UPI000BAF8B0C|nr:MULTISPECIES: OsmC family protein [Chitinophaga]ASZ12777.1 peroxiredoxin [Chitinophaga sp. MD30]UCJ09601.1 OsmC family protein [Chitinophaga pendula]